jgi:uncharacterized DUF497 family protein
MFDYDPVKSRANLAKHGIDFATAQLVWLDIGRAIIPARSDTELRFAVVGKIGEKHWTVFATMRNDLIRIISARRSRLAEVRGYDEEDN